MARITWSFDRLHSAHYHGAKGWLSSTSLKTLAKYPPATYLHESQNQVHKDYFGFGNVTHSVIPENTIGNLIEIVAVNWMAKAAKEARIQARAEGHTPLVTKDVAKIHAMRDAIMTNPDAASLLTGHVAELSYFTGWGSFFVPSSGDTKTVHCQ